MPEAGERDPAFRFDAGKTFRDRGAADAQVLRHRRLGLLEPVDADHDLAVARVEDGEERR